MRLAAGVLAILLYPVVVVALIAPARSPLFVAAVVVIGGLGFVLAWLAVARRQRTGRDVPMDEAAADFTLAVMALFWAAVVATLALESANSQRAYTLFICGVAAAWTLLWLPRRMRRVTMTTSVLINRDPAAVFAFVSDERNSPKYMPQVESVEKITDGDIGSGTQFRIRMRTPAGMFDGVDQIFDYEWAHRLTDSTVSGRRPNRGTLTFEPAQAGTLLSYRYDSEVTYAGALLGQGLQRGQLAAAMAANRSAIWGRLKQILETPAAVDTA